MHVKVPRLTATRPSRIRPPITTLTTWHGAMEAFEASTTKGPCAPRTLLVVAGLAPEGAKCLKARRASSST